MANMVNAYSLKEAKEHIGRIVYRSYRPQQVGKIVDVKEVERHYGLDYEFLVHWQGSKNKPNNAQWESHLADFESLVEDHERKGKKFRKVLNEAKSTL